MPSYIILLLCVMLYTSSPTQASLPGINDQQAVVQTVLGSEEPLSTWQQLVAQHNNPIAAEQAADAVLSRLQFMPAQDIFVPLLKHWQKHQAVKTRPSDDHGHEVGVYLIAARASGELNRLLSEQTARYVYALADHQLSELLTELNELYQQPQPAISSGIKAAVKNLTPLQKQRLIEQQLATGQVNPISPLLATALDSPAIQQMIVESEQPAAIASLLKAWQHNPTNNIQWLKTIAQHPGPQQIQAVALFSRVQLSHTDEKWLISLLNDDKLGRTAARVLGHQNNGKLMDKLFQHWQQNNSEPLTSNLLYALSRNPVGLNKLKTVSQQKSNRLSKNQQQWLKNQLGADYAQ